MHTVIYVDMLFLINALISYFLLRTVGVLCGFKPNFLLLALSSIAAGFSSFIILLPRLSILAILVYNVAIAAVICFLAFGYISVRMLLRSMFWYLALNLALAGVVMAAVYYLGASGIQANNLAVYFDISPLVLLLCVVIIYLCVKLSGLIFTPINADEKAEISFICNGNQCECTAMVDTGFGVNDMWGKATFLVSLSCVKPQISPTLYNDLNSYLSGGTPNDTVFTIACISTVTGYKALPSVKVSQVLIKYKKQEIRLKEAGVIFTNQNIGQGAYGGIIGTKLLS